MPIARVAKRAVLLTVCALTLTNCSETALFDHDHIIPAPASGIAIASAPDGNVIVLAGTSASRGLYLLDSHNGTVLESFGVTAQASSIAADISAGYLVGISGSRNTGAIERYSPSGEKFQVIPMPGAVVDMSPVLDRHVYLLIRKAKQDVAVRFDLDSLRIEDTVPVASTVDHIIECRIDDSDYLLENDLQAITITNLRTRAKATIRGGVAKTTCTPEGQLHGFILEHRALKLETIAFPNGLRLRSHDVPPNALRIAATANTDTLVVLNSSENSGSVEIIPHASYGFVPVMLVPGAPTATPNSLQEP